MKKGIISLLSIALVALIGGAVYVSADGNSDFEERLPFMQERHPDFSEEELNEMYQWCHSKGRQGSGHRHGHWQEGPGHRFNQGQGNGQQFEDFGPEYREERGYGHGHGRGMMGHGQGHGMMGRY